MPDWKQIVRGHLAPLRMPPEREIEIVEELAQHLEAVYEEALGEGATEPEARARALRAIADGRLLECELSRVERPLAVRWLPPEYLERRGGMRMESLLQDLRYGLRRLLKNPGFTAIAVLTLAVGIGATTAVFSLVRSILLRPPPYAAPERLALVWGTNRKAGQLRDVISGPNFLDLRRQNTVFEETAAFTVTEMAARREQGTGVIPRLEVTPEFFPVLGAQPLLGRVFEASDGLPGRDQVALLTHSYWQRRFGGDPAIVGKTLAVIGQPHMVVGVLPPNFEFSGKPDLITPLVESALEQQERTHYHYWAIGRLKPGVSLAQAERDLDGVMGRIAQQFPNLRGWEVTVDSLQTVLVEPVRPALLTLLAAVGLVLLIGCVNVANLLLARGVERGRELAIRAALGADRARMLRQLLTESALLAGLAGLLGVALAGWLVEAMRWVLPAAVPLADSAAMVSLPPVRLDGEAMLFGLALAALTVLLCGLLPAMKFSVAQVGDALKAAATRTTGDQSRARSLLIAVETALATALLIVAGLMLRTVFALVHTDPGFRADRVLTMNFGRLHDLDAAARARYYTEVVRAVQALPGVSAAALNDYILLQNEDDYEGLRIEGRPQPPPGAGPREEWRRISPDYFRVMGMPLLNGRAFAEADNETAPSVVIINQALARKYWPNEDPVGRRIRITHRAYEWSEIVGVAGDVREVGLDKPAKPMMFVPYQRAPRPVMGLFVQTSEPPEHMLPIIQRAVWSVDPTQPIFNVNRLEQLAADSMSVQRLTLLVSAVLAALAAALTAVGIYGVVGYATSQRTREIGLRMALGAGRRNVFWLVVKQGMTPAAFGLISGLVGALAVTRLLAGQLYGVRPADPLTYAGVALLLTAVALLACTVPARRATKIEPLAALRYE